MPGRRLLRRIPPRGILRADRHFSAWNTPWEVFGKKRKSRRTRNKRVSYTVRGSFCSPASLRFFEKIFGRRSLFSPCIPLNYRFWVIRRSPRSAGAPAIVAVAPSWSFNHSLFIVLLDQFYRAIICTQRSSNDCGLCQIVTQHRDNFFTLPIFFNRHGDRLDEYRIGYCC